MGKFSWNDFRFGIISLPWAKNLLNFDRTFVCAWLLSMSKTADDMGVHDHGSIVWDEFVGVFIVLAAIPTLSLPWIVIAFVLFRFFDILKPYPIRYFDQKLESGFGIMVDDVLAAIYAVIVIVILRILGLPC